MKYLKWFVIFVLELFIPFLLIAQDHGFSDKNAISHYSRDRTYDVQHIKLELQRITILLLFAKIWLHKSFYVYLLQESEVNT